MCGHIMVGMVFCIPHTMHMPTQCTHPHTHTHNAHAHTMDTPTHTTQWTHSHNAHTHTSTPHNAHTHTMDTPTQWTHHTIHTPTQWTHPHNGHTHITASLYDLLKHNGPLIADDVIHYSYQMFDALDFLHTKLMMVHCDIKRKHLL